MCHLALLVPLALAFQDPQPTTQDVKPVQEPTEDVQRGAAEIAELLDSGWRTNIGGYGKFSYMYSDDVDIYGHRGAGGVSVDALRLWVEGKTAGWNVHVGLRGERFNDYGYFGVVGETGNLRSVDVTLAHEILDDIWFSVGKFRPPFVSSALYEENALLFPNRSFIGGDWDFYETGAMVSGTRGPLHGWVSVQNGNDNFGNRVAITVRGLWDVIGKGAGQRWEGPLGADDNFNLTVGGGLYYDTDTDDSSAQSAEIYGTFGPWYFGLEAVDNGDGLGDLFSWSITNSFRIAEDWDISARVEDFDRDDNTDLTRLGVNHYIIGHDVKLQASYASADSNAPLADVQVLQLALVVSF